MSVSSANFRFEFVKIVNAKIGTGKDTQTASVSKKYRVPKTGMEKSEGLMQTKANVTAMHREVREKKSESGT